MVNLTSIQVVSNAPEGLNLRIDDREIRIISPDEASGTLPSLFLFSTASKQFEDMDAQLEGWVNVTKKFIAAYHSLESFGIMLAAQTLHMSPEQPVEMVNECLELMEPIQQITISVLTYH